MSDSRHVGTLAVLDIGMTIYSGSRRHGKDDTPIGGVIVQIESRPILEDDELTGEVIRVYEVLSPWEPDLSRAFHHIEEADVDLDNAEPAQDSRLRKLVCRLDEAVAKKRGKQFDSRDARYQALASRLMGVIFGGSRI